MGRTPLDPIERFLRFVNKTDSCWLWTSAKNHKGYGFFWFDGKPRGAHTVSLWLFRGLKPVSDQMVCHHCDNPSCVHPDHLYIGNNSKNMEDMWRRGRRSGKSPDCHPNRRHVGHGLCCACYKQLKRGPRYCQVCGTKLDKHRAKTCDLACAHQRNMELQRIRRESSC